MFDQHPELQSPIPTIVKDNAEAESTEVETEVTEKVVDVAEHDVPLKDLYDASTGHNFNKNQNANPWTIPDLVVVSTTPPASRPSSPTTFPGSDPTIDPAWHFAAGQATKDFTAWGSN